MCNVSDPLAVMLSALHDLVLFGATMLRIFFFNCTDLGNETIWTILELNKHLQVIGM